MRESTDSMLYTVKRYFLTKAKTFENRYRTWEKKREIDRAYKSGTISLSISINRPLFIKIVIGIVGSGLILTGALYTGRLVKNIDFSGISLPKKSTVTTEKEPAPTKPVTSIYEAKNGPPEKKNNLVSTPPKDIVLKPLPRDRRAYKFPDKMQHFILANKMNDTMYFLKNTNGKWSLFREYSIAHGAREGRKLREGDRKTPEGLYFITGRKEKYELHKMYGPMAFVLNYPNKEDREAGRTGNGIWIHGTNPDSLPIDTRGCLELNNTDLAELGTLIKLGIGVPVFIINKELKKKPEAIPDYNKIWRERRDFLARYNKKSEFFIAVLNEWETAWESKRIENYEKMYTHDDFFGQGLDWDAWRVKKAGTFQIYTKIDISLDNIFLADFSETTAVLKFVQKYESDRFKTVDGKRLSLVKKEEQWKICKENPISKEELLL